MKKEVRLSLAYRDMWQSWGRYFPTAAQLREVAPAIVSMGCFDRVETNGGAFEQVCLLMGENPNKAVREWTAPFNAAGIQTMMLERGLSAEVQATMEKRAEVMKYSLIVVASLPMMIMYPFIQKYFVKGIMLGAVKG